MKISRQKSNQKHINPKGYEKIRLQNDDSRCETNTSGVSVEISSTRINIPYLNLIEYSGLIQEEIARNPIFSIFCKQIQEIQQKANQGESSIITFLNLLKKEEVEMKNDEISDLIELSKIFKVESLQMILKKYLEEHKNDIDLMLSLKISQERKGNLDLFDNDELSEGIEEKMKNNINECLDNEKISQISISTIYRMIEGSQEKVSTEKLYKFIQESIEERHVLFRFIEIEEMSEESFEELYHQFESAKKRKENNSFYYEYFAPNLRYIKTMKDQQKKLEERIKTLEAKQKEVEEENRNIKCEKLKKRIAT